MEELKPHQFLSLVINYVVFALLLIIAVLWIQDIRGVYELSIFTAFLFAIQLVVNIKAYFSKGKKKRSRAKGSIEAVRPNRRTDIDWNAPVTSLKKSEEELQREQEEYRNQEQSNPE